MTSSTTYTYLGTKLTYFRHLDLEYCVTEDEA